MALPISAAETRPDLDDEHKPYPKCVGRWCPSRREGRPAAGELEQQLTARTLYRFEEALGPDQFGRQAFDRSLQTGQ